MEDSRRGGERLITVVSVRVLQPPHPHCGLHFHPPRPGLHFLDAPAALQKSRLMQRDGIDEALAERMIAAQATRTQRLALADDIVVNDGDVAHLQAAIKELDARYRVLAAGNFSAP